MTSLLSNGSIAALHRQVFFLFFSGIGRKKLCITRLRSGGLGEWLDSRTWTILPDLELYGRVHHARGDQYHPRCRDQGKDPAKSTELLCEYTRPHSYQCHARTVANWSWRKRARLNSAMRKRLFLIKPGGFTKVRHGNSPSTVQASL